MLTRKLLRSTDRIFWYPTNLGDAPELIWINDDINYAGVAESYLVDAVLIHNSMRIFGCIRDGLFYYVEN